MSTHRPVFNDQTDWSITYKTTWYDTLRDLLYSVSSEEEGYSFSEESIDNIEQLYEKHKIRIYN